MMILLLILSLLAHSAVCKRSNSLHLYAPKSPVPDKDLPVSQWFTQKLDHYNSSDVRVWKQQYLVNKDYYSEGGPVFLMLGGEGPLSKKWMGTGNWIDNAKKFKAICFSIEHRYYGKSKPTNDTSVPNLQYLRSQQALEDAAHFIRSMNSQYSLGGNKWIVFGGSYPGSLAAWLRLKHSELVYAAVSTSGPMLAQVNFKEYLGVVTEALGTECDMSVAYGISQLESDISNPSQFSALDKKFSLCAPLATAKKVDLQNLMETVSGNFEEVVQYNNDKRASGHSVTTQQLCDIMSDDKLGVLDSLAAVNSFMLKTNNESCLDYKYGKMITELQKPVFSASRTWFYQTCTEFGWYQSSDLHKQPFGHYFPIQFLTQQCTDVFGKDFNLEQLMKGIKFTNQYYQGKNPKVTNVLYVNGSLDPWHVLGILSDLNPTARALLINGTAHCANMYPASPSDPPQLTAARIHIQSVLSGWIHQ